MEKIAETQGIRPGRKRAPRGSVLPLVLAGVIILMLIGGGLMSLSLGIRQAAKKEKNETVALLAAEAGLERAVYWMCQQPDLLNSLQGGPHTGVETFSNSTCDYSVDIHDYIGSRLVYRVISNGHAGIYNRTADVYLLQGSTGWDMGMCRVPSGSASTSPVNFATGEVIDIPIHINCYGNPDDSERDIHISGTPQFLQVVEMGESKGSKYPSSIMNLFQSGIYFNQPDCKVTNEAVIQSKMNRFQSTTKAQFVFTPAANAAVTNAQAAVQLEFYRGADGIGYVEITNHCSVRGYRQSSSNNTWDFRVVPGTDATQFNRYYIYGYHYIPQNAVATGQRFVVPMTATEVSPYYGSTQAPPCGQIFVNGNVIIGSKIENAASLNAARLNTVQGKMIVVATGNIWIADSLEVSDYDNAGTYYPRNGNGMPGDDNPNSIGLLTQGVIRVVDPGLIETLGGPTAIGGGSAVYEPISLRDSGYPAGSYHRHLPDPVIIEAAMIIGGGGFGAENVKRGSYGGRKETSGSQDDLIIRGTITEVIRSVVAQVGTDGFRKIYYHDLRMMEGVLPSDIWLRGKFIPAPAGWYDYR